MLTAEKLMEEVDLQGVDLIKIDVEGHEEAVLRSLSPIIARHNPRAILFEHHGSLDHPKSFIRGLFEDLRYRIFGLQKTLFRLRLVSLERLVAQGRSAPDYLAVSPSIDKFQIRSLARNTVL